ncbi:MAG TPA: hypothetical protein VMT19_03095 [Thermoanaerobaculaceae bacterium]|nr:hypothetical protein [Thermoanaerobaculaceae bacterium]
MTAVLKVAACAILAAGIFAETARIVPAPGFAVVSGTLVALYLWFLAKARPYLRPKS